MSSAQTETEVGGAGLASLAPAVLCVGMMGLMMVGMSHTRRGG